MADIENKNKNLPLIIGGVIVGIVVLYMVFKPKRGPSPEERAARAAALRAGLPPPDPCLKPDGTRIPDWACGTVALLNPLAQAGTSIYQSKVNLDLQKAQLRQQQARGY